MSDELLDLTREALALAEEASPTVSAIARRAYRIAWLRGDLEAIYWLAYELYPTGSRLAHSPIKRDVLRHLAKDDAKALHERTLDRYLESRAVTMLDSDGAPDGEQKVSGASLGEMEVHIASLNKQAEEIAYDQDTMAYGSSVDLERTLRRGMRWVAAENQKVLTRVLTRIHSFLVATQADLEAGKSHATIVQRNHEFVEVELAHRLPGALTQLRNASQLAMGDDSESWSMAGTSCRRALKAVADELYPARPEPVVGADGKTRDLSDDKWVNRLWQFIGDKVASSGAQAALRTDLESLGVMVESLNAMSSKGVHADLNSTEAEICVTRSYMLIGDLLRLSKDVSGLDAVDVDKPDDEISSRLVDLHEGTT